ncbi:MAG: hypothetical protein M3R38_08770 [Actinomycetota bacterium]|nr:hypothetical protein [Actinomycetota bacterium]MDP9475767.1 hypothetical protein [Actinomycetota bacterium]MDP9484832.1 hypothetical protein [Actinomycetota bacterium]
MTETVMATVVLMIGAVFVVSVLGWFWVGGGYRQPPEGLGPAERAWVAGEVGDLLAELAPEAILLAERERLVEAALLDERDGALVIVARRRLAEAGLRGFWEGFVRASVLVEEDPALALRELRALRIVVKEALDVCEEVLGMLGVVEEMVKPVERGEGRGGE